MLGLRLNLKRRHLALLDAALECGDLYVLLALGMADQVDRFGWGRGGTHNRQPVVRATAAGCTSG